jgi:hypothetical protein
MPEQQTSAASEGGRVILTRLPPSELIDAKRVKFFDGLRTGSAPHTKPKSEAARPEILSVEWEQQLSSHCVGQQQQQQTAIAQAPLVPVRRVSPHEKSRPLCNYMKHQRRAQQLRDAGKEPAYVTSSTPYVDPFRAQLDKVRLADTKARAMHGSLFRPGGQRDEWRAFLETTGFAASFARDPQAASAKSAVRCTESIPHGRRSNRRCGEAGGAGSDRNGQPQRL